MTALHNFLTNQIVESIQGVDDPHLIAETAIQVIAKALNRVDGRYVQWPAEGAGTIPQTYAGALHYFANRMSSTDPDPEEEDEPTG